MSSRTTTATLFAITLLAPSVLAYSTYAYAPANNQAIHRREAEVFEFLARELAERDYEQQRRSDELLELLARDSPNLGVAIESAVQAIKDAVPAVKQAVEAFKTAAPAIKQAVNQTSTVVDTVKNAIDETKAETQTQNQTQQNVKARELGHFMARQEEKLARDLHVLARDVLECVHSLHLNQRVSLMTACCSRRMDTVDTVEALSRRNDPDYGTGFAQGVSKSMETVLPIISSHLRREELDHIIGELAHGLARRTIEDAQAEAESGALSWDGVKSFAKDFGKGFVQGFTKTAEAVLPVAAAFIRREQLDEVKRALREEGGVIARRAIENVMKREMEENFVRETMMRRSFARSLNELD